MLHGREAELLTLDVLLRRSRNGEGGGLVLRGEPGIGKSALLASARERADGFQVLEAAGLEAESELGYATLHQLLFPVLDQLDRLPEPQAGALGVAFGMHSGPTPDRFLVALATLTLLSETAGERPVLCLVDDAHWADRPSLDALTFVGRRLVAERIALLLSARAEEGASVSPDGLERLDVAGLADEPARAVLLEHGGGRLTPSEQEELLVAGAGNPLALREFARTGPRPNPAGEPIPLAEGLRRAFRARVHCQDPAARRVLLLVAAAGSGRPDLVRHAAASLGMDLAPLDAGDLDDLVVSDGSRMSFRHPLIRSAVYHDAGPGERRAAHRALAETLRDQPTEADRRAWHLAHAAEGADPVAANELERSAERAICQAGPAAAAVALERAAALSPSSELRDRRLVAASAAWLQAGDTAQATALLATIEIESPDRDALAQDVTELRALLAIRTGSPAEAVELLSKIVPEVPLGDRSKAVELLLLLGEAGFAAGRPEVWPRIEAVTRGIPEPSPEADDGLVGLLRAVHATLIDGVRSAPVDAVALERLPNPYTLVSAAGMLSMLCRFELSRRLRKRATRQARALGAAGTLAWILLGLVIEEFLAGRFSTAYTHAEEGLRLAEETGQPNTAYRHQSLLAVVAAYQGRQSEAQRLAERALTEGTLRDLPDVVAWSRHALGLTDLLAGRGSDALRQLEAMRRPGSEDTRVLLRAVPDLVEAAVRSGQPERAGELFARFAEWANSTRAAELLALAARCRALLAGGEDAEAEFTTALTLHARAHWPMEAARTQLLFGEYLRRRRRRADARGPLREAYEGFTRLGAVGWADRARAELRATGESTGAPPAQVLAELTAQELRIALAISEGATNREVAAQLFLSARTVDYHLRKVFSKLGLTSRAELVRLVVAEHPPT